MRTCRRRARWLSRSSGTTELPEAPVAGEASESAPWSGPRASPAPLDRPKARKRLMPESRELEMRFGTEPSSVSACAAFWPPPPNVFRLNRSMPRKLMRLQKCEPTEAIEYDDAVCVALAVPSELCAGAVPICWFRLKAGATQDNAAVRPRLGRLFWLVRLWRDQEFRIRSSISVAESSIGSISEVVVVTTRSHGCSRAATVDIRLSGFLASILRTHSRNGLLALEKEVCSVCILPSTELRSMD
mmetsp:Transcript_124989/g.358846  ORF Transcript_124989/g.358846 Transcript_124989/m.358846 type:complete len:244 (-) Transcript_124989:413-1144(-)